MIICITAQGHQLEASVDQRFGRCQYFIFMNLDTQEFEAIQNPNVSGMGGVGIQSAQLVAEKCAQVVITGKVGPNASSALQSAGIKVVLNVSGNIKDAVERFKKGEILPSVGPNADEKAGLS